MTKNCMTKTHETLESSRKPDGILTSRKGNVTIITEIFFSRDSSATFQDRLIKAVAAEDAA